MGSWIRALVVSVVLGSVGAASIAPSAASAAATVTIDAPADGSTQSAPYSGPLTLTFSGVTGETYGIEVTGVDGYVWSATTTPASDGSYDFPIAPADNAGGYTVRVVDQSAATVAQASFTVTKANAAGVVSPPPGSDVQPGFAGPVSVAWTSVSNTGHTYDVAVAGPGGAVATCMYPGAGLEGTTTDCATGVLEPGD
jgi:methionine-rich copper-binding protein CopC